MLRARMPQANRRDGSQQDSTSQAVGRSVVRGPRVRCAACTTAARAHRPG